MSRSESASDASAAPSERRRFIHIAGAGMTFQAGSAAVDSSTIMAALVFQLTGSPIAVGDSVVVITPSENEKKLRALFTA